MKGRKNLYASIVGWGMFLAGAFAFSSCADEEIMEAPAVTGDAISFITSKSNSVWEPDQTRSVSSKEKQTIRCESSDGDFSIDVTIEDGIRSSKTEQVQSRGAQIKEKGGWNYKVGAYYTTDTDATGLDSKSVNFFAENASGGLSIASDADNYTTNYYWPPVGTMKFFAVAPADIVGTPNDAGATFAIPTLDKIETPTLTYTIPETVADQKDIMVAQTTVNCSSQNTAVGLQFEHLLAAVQFKVGAMQFIKINSLKVTGVYGGEVTFTYNNGVWTSSATTSTEYDLTSVIADTSGLIEGDEITSNKSNSIMLVTPQTLPEGAKIVVSYTETITDLTYNREATLSGEWVAGKTTVYALNISGTDFGTVEIPRPDDQDAHYIMVEMGYNMGNLLNGDKIKSVKATAQWKKDENDNDISGNTSTKSGISLKFASELSETQKQGFWTDKRYVETITVNSTDESDTTGSKEDTTTDSHGNTGLRGGDYLNITEGENTIVLFIEENNGDTDREGELIFTAILTSDVEIVIGKGSFKQLCPSWDKDRIGVERIETDNTTYAFGFDYTRKVEYTNPGKKWIILLQRIGMLLYTWGASSIISDDEGDFITLKTGSLGSFTYIESITLDYGALSEVQEITNSEDGLVNTQALYDFTAGVDIEQVETEFDENLTWNKNVVTEGEGSPEDYAAFMALSRNRMYEKKTIVISSSSKDSVITYKATLYKDGGTDLEGNDIIEWYLPSSAEAQNLVETGVDNDGNESVIDDLNGTYWSSTAGSNTTPAQAYTFTYNNNTFSSVQSAARTEKYKVRAVRKKP